MRPLFLWSVTLCCVSISSAGAGEPQEPIWPGKPPGETKTLPPETDIYKPTDKRIAGRPIIKLANVSTPTIEVFRPAKSIDTHTAVIICPGGGHHILAYDLEGTEVAQWLTTIGVTGIVLKYRVPFRDKDVKWRAAVQDAQRAVSVVRSRCEEWGIQRDRIGVCGFSAGGQTAALTAILNKRTYQPVDVVDKESFRPNFAILVYPAWLVKPKTTDFVPEVKVDKSTPPMFLAHAYDDRVSPLNSVLLFAELKKAGVPSELHVYSRGGHGYGLRETDAPVTTWSKRCAEWLASSGWLKR